MFGLNKHSSTQKDISGQKFMEDYSILRSVLKTDNYNI